MSLDARITQCNTIHSISCLGQISWKNKTILYSIFILSHLWFVIRSHVTMSPLYRVIPLFTKVTNNFLNKYINTSFSYLTSLCHELLFNSFSYLTWSPWVIASISMASRNAVTLRIPRVCLLWGPQSDRNSPLIISSWAWHTGISNWKGLNGTNNLPIKIFSSLFVFYIDD